MSREEFEALLIMFGCRKREYVGKDSQWHCPRGQLMIRIRPDGQCNVDLAGGGWTDLYSFEDAIIRLVRLGGVGS